MSEQCQWERGCFVSSPSNMQRIGGYDSSAACDWPLLWSILSREIHLLLYWVWVAVGGCSRMLKEPANQAGSLFYLRNIKKK